MDREYITDLIEKYISGRATSSEEQELQRWYRGADLSNEPAEGWLPGEKELLKQRMLAGLRRQMLADQSSAAPVKIGRMHFVRRMAAAVAALIVLAGTGYLLFRKPSRQLAVLHPLSDQILPGHPGAILILGNGSQIVLDSAANGNLGRQGASALTKGGGMIAYSSLAGAGNIPVVYNTLSTPRGRSFRLRLPDGTQVWLNAASSITFPTAFTEANRKVTLTGEGYFEVTSDPGRPFIVQAGSSTIKVLGTHFNIMAYPDEKEVRTTLLEGSIQLSALGKTILLHPGQQGRPDTRMGKLLVAAADTDQVTAWKNGLFDFQGADIRTIMRQISRWYVVDVSYERNIPGRKFVGQIVRDAELSRVLHVLELAGIHFKVEGRKVTVLP